MWLKKFINKNEKILWQGSPEAKCILFECIFNSWLILSIAWFLFVFLMMTKGGWNSLLRDIESSDELYKLGIKALIIVYSLGPIVVYLCSIIASYVKAKNISYIVTDQAIYLGYGLFDLNCRRKSFMDFAQISIHFGIADRLFGTGDIIISEKGGFANKRNSSFGYNARNNFGMFDIINIKDYERVFKLIKDLQTDIYSDVMFPNSLRPEFNHGYKSKLANNFNTLE